MGTLGYSKFCARWVPRQLTEAHKQSRLEACFELLEYCHSDKTFLQRIVTGNESWVHHFEPESKKASMEWRHPTSPRPKKFKFQQSAGKVMVTVFWDSVGVILVDFISKGATIISDVYIDTLKKLKARIRQTWHRLTSICLGPSKKFWGRHFSSEEVKTAVRKWLKTQPIEFYNEGICALVKRWEKAVWKAGDHIEK